MHEVSVSKDHVMRVRISGVMQVADQQAIQHVAADLLDHDPELRVLTILDHFEGWESSDAWGDDWEFLMKYGNRINRMAVVGEARWKDDALLFTGAGFRGTAIEYFPDSSLTEAEAWVRAS